MSDDTKGILDAMNPAKIVEKVEKIKTRVQEKIVRSREYEKDQALLEVRFNLAKLDQMVRIDGADIFSEQDVKDLEEEKNKLEMLWQVVRNAKK